MQLTSFTFLFAFLPVSLLFLLFLKEKLPWQNAALLILSVLFCAASGLAGFLAGLLETLAVSGAGRPAEGAENGFYARRSFLCRAALLFQVYELLAGGALASNRVASSRARWRVVSDVSSDLVSGGRVPGLHTGGATV